VRNEKFIIIDGTTEEVESKLNELSNQGYEVKIEKIVPANINDHKGLIAIVSLKHKDSTLMHRIGGTE